jgi:hypothetical protein
MMPSSPPQHPVHPAAAVWPMLPEPDLRRLAADIAANGLHHPIVLDPEGQILDGRNREAACQIAEVVPDYVTYDGDPIAYILSANNERRHLSLPERAAATALTLAADGRRENGRWKRGSVPEGEKGESAPKETWKRRMTEAGLVLDHAPELLPQVAAGELALDAAVKEAAQRREQQAQLGGLPIDLRALVEAEELAMADALRRTKLSERYAKLVAAGELSLAEAEHLNEREAREYRESIQRAIDALEGFLFGWTVASTLRQTATRADVLAGLSDYDRAQFLEIERETWPTTTT